MGFDLYGKSPTANKGTYFRNNVWWWRPLWEYVTSNCPVLTQKDCQYGCSNSGHLIDDDKAKEVARTLKKLIKKGVVKQYAVAYKWQQKHTKIIQCDTCGGKGRLEDREDVVDKCIMCNGKGEYMDPVKNYPFSEANVKSFARFCEKSGGFTIC